MSKSEQKAEIWVTGNDVTPMYPPELAGRAGRIIEVSITNAASRTHICSFQPSWFYTIVGFVTENEIADDDYNAIHNSMEIGSGDYGGKPTSKMGYHDKDMTIADDDDSDTIKSVVERYICNGSDYEMEIGRIFGLSWAKDDL